MKYLDTDHSVVAAPFQYDPNKWVIYRENGDEILVYIKDNKIVGEKRLTEEEQKHLIKHALK